MKMKLYSNRGQTTLFIPSQSAVGKVRRNGPNAKIYSTPLDDLVFLPSSTNYLSSAATTTTASTVEFEPIAPDANILIGFGVVTLLSVIAGFVWANEVVPVSRTKLALSKRDGEVKEYLDGLREEEENPTENTTTTISEENDQQILAESTKNSNNNDRQFEKWLFTDWLENNKSAGKPGRKKEPALPILKNAKWNSGDNPVLVTFALLFICVIFASVTERVSGSLL